MALVICLLFIALCLTLIMASVLAFIYGINCLKDGEMFGIASIIFSLILLMCGVALIILPLGL